MFVLRMKIWLVSMGSQTLISDDKLYFIYSCIVNHYLPLRFILYDIKW